eukprot:6243958-Ditylum_brightwellii.AAC.1
MVAKTCLKGGLEEEIKLTLEEKYKEWEESETPGKRPLTHEEWKVLPPDHEKKQVSIIVSFDMGWQRRGF